MFAIRLIFILAVLVAGTAQAQTGLRTPGNGVAYQVDENVFEVVGNSGRGGVLFWCGASEFARRVLGAPWQAEVTVVRSFGLSAVTGRKSAVQFSLNPEAVGVTKKKSYSYNAMEVGDFNTLTAARRYCSDISFPF